MGRAIVREPQVFLMDEPLSNLDAKLRVQTRAQIASLQQRLGVTTVYVTHDQVEAMTMGDRVAALKDGVLMQCDTPQDLYDRPANVFVAGFIGSPAMNLLELPLVEQGAMLGVRVLPLDRAVIGDTKLDGDRVTVGMRPEDLAITTEDGWPFTVTLVEGLGADAYVHGTVPLRDGTTIDITMRTDGRKQPTKGESLLLTIDQARIHAFDPTSGVRLGS